jgi:hypothetical protein
MTSFEPDELRAAAAAEHELGREYEPAVLASFADRLGMEIDRRVDERIVPRRGPDFLGLLLALGSIGMALGIPSATFDKLGAPATFLLTVIGWIAIAAINIAYARQR